MTTRREMFQIWMAGLVGSCQQARRSRRSLNLNEIGFIPTAPTLYFIHVEQHCLGSAQYITCLTKGSLISMISLLLLAKSLLWIGWSVLGKGSPLKAVSSDHKWEMMSASAHEFLREYSPLNSIFILHEDAFSHPDIQDLIQNVDTDPDFYVERIIKSLRVELADTSLPTYMPPPKNNTGPTGYIYFQYFDNHKCGGKLLSETGVGLDSCLSYPGMKLSYRVGLSQAGNCSTAMVVSYYDAGCEELKYIGQFPLTFSSSCNVVDDNTSFVGVCHNQPTIPVNFQGVMDAGYEGDVTCSDKDAVIQYVNTPSQSCYLGVPPGTFTFPFPNASAVVVPSNFSWDLYSYKFLCDSNTYADHYSGKSLPQNYSVAIYWDSYFCDDEGDNVQVYSYSASCEVEDFDFPFAPTPFPTELPTSSPSLHQSPVPTEQPSSQPSVHGFTYRPSSRPTRNPTSQPSSAPSINGTATPSYASTAAPTQWGQTLEYYYAQEAFKGTIKRSCVYVNQSTPAPTVAPTQEPTVEPTIEPTMEPTVAPSNVPATLAPTPYVTRGPTLVVTSKPSTRRPTVSPSTRTPTGVPTIVTTAAPSQEPTWAPAATPVTILDVNQVLSGLNATVFNNPATKTQYEEAFIAAVVKSLSPYVTASNVYNLVVKSYSTSASSSAVMSSSWLAKTVGHMRLASTTPQSQASYSIYVPDNSTATSSASLTSQLESSVNSGDFDQYLTTYATQYNAPGLAGTTTSALSIVDGSPATGGSNDSGSILTGNNVIIVAVIAGVVGVGLVIALVYFMRGRSRQPAAGNRKFPGHGSSSGGPRYSSAASGSYRSGGNLHQMDDDDDVSFDAEARKVSSYRSNGNKPAVELRPTNTTTTSATRGSVLSASSTTAVPAKSPFNSSKNNAPSANVTTITKVQEDNWFSFEDAFAAGPATGPAATVPRPAQPAMDADLLFFPSVPAEGNTVPQAAAPVKSAPAIAPPPPSNPVKRPPPNPFATSSAPGQSNPPSTLFNASLPTTIAAFSGPTGSQSSGKVPILPPPPGGNKPRSATATKPTNSAPWLPQDDNFDPL